MQFTEDAKINFGSKDPKTLNAKVIKVNVDGLQRTKNDVVCRLAKTLFNNQTFEQVAQNVIEMTTKMKTLGLFKETLCLLDVNGTSTAPGALDVNIFVQETPRYSGGVSTTFGNNEGNAILHAKMPNLWGRGELAQLQFKYGTRNTMGYNLSFLKPLFIKGDPKLILSFFDMSTEHPFSGYNQCDKGFSKEITFNTRASMKHTFRWEAMWRNLSNVTPQTAFEIREDFGHNIKSSLKHEFVYDKRNKPIFATKGAVLKCTQELAGFGGNIQHFKNELEYQTNRLLFDSVIFQASFKGGILNNLGDRKTLICDKFFLGGPLCIRGFQTNGIGPQSNGYALGASSYWSTGLHLYTRLPFIAKDSAINEMARFHLFATAGNIGNFTLAEDYHQYLRSVVANTRCSVGFGLAISLSSIARFEVNFSVPYSYQQSDRLNPGLQFGIGTEYL